MEEYSPGAAARALGIAPGTLRKWSQEFAELLSPAAAASGPRARRRYSATDMALLRSGAALLDQGRTYAQALAELGGRADDGPPVEARPLVGAVEVLQPGDQQQALVQLLDAQRQIVEAQRALIAQLQEAGEQQRQLVEHQAAQLDQARQQIEDTRADLAGQLAEARAHWARLPRWARWWFGEGE